jgi:hypothetical protein
VIIWNCKKEYAMTEKDYQLYGTKVLNLKNTRNWIVDLYLGE